MLKILEGGASTLGWSRNRPCLAAAESPARPMVEQSRPGHHLSANKLKYLRCCTVALSLQRKLAADSDLVVR